MTDAVPDCQACGACCFSEGRHYVPLTGEDHARLLPAERRALTEFDDSYYCYMRMVDGRCAALRVEAGRYTCAIYRRRPQTCRDYEQGGDACVHDRGQREARTRLPTV